MVKSIPLSQGKFALVDDDDYALLSQKKWFYCYGYARRTQHLYTDSTGQKQKPVLMHRELIHVPEGFFVDHINRDGLDNRKCNLRVCSLTENNRNIGVRSNNTSGYKGVSWKKDKDKWKACITINKRQIHLGYFDDINEAALAYNNAARLYFKEFAFLNTIGDGYGKA